jgi:hypothetical protein
MPLLTDFVNITPARDEFINYDKVYAAGQEPRKQTT